MLFLSLILTDSCKKDKRCDNIPKVFVDLVLYLNLPSYSTLGTPNNWVYINGGNRGIIVYRKSESEFIATDRICTYDPDNSSATLQVQTNNITAIDNGCGSKFQITDGAVTQGPASCSLVKYHTEYDASANTLHIYN